MIQPKLKEWARRELDRRGWSLREAAARGNIGYTGLRRCLDPHERVGIKGAQALATIFNTPLENVLEMAEMLPAKPPETHETRQLVHIYHRLSEEKRRELLQFAEFLRDGGKRR